MNVQDYLQHRHVRFTTIEHETAYTASELAQSTHTKGAEVAKTVLVKIDDGYAIAILPSTRRLDLEALADLLGVKSARLADEQEINELFPEVEAGIVPPFGAEYGLRTIVDIHLGMCQTIVFEGTTHREAVRVRFEDFEMLENPINGLISCCD